MLFALLCKAKPGTLSNIDGRPFRWTVDNPDA